MKIVAPLVALVALAGCQAEESAANRSAAINTVAEIPAPAAKPARPAIPERFRGLWAEDQRACGALTHHSRLVVGDDDLRFPDFVLEVEQVSETGEGFAVKGRNKTSDAPTEAHYSIDVTGGILTDEAGGGTARVRCG